MEILIALHPPGGVIYEHWPSTLHQLQCSTYVFVAQLARALVSYYMIQLYTGLSKGREFEPHRGHHFAVGMFVLYGSHG